MPFDHDIASLPPQVLRDVQGVERVLPPEAMAFLAALDRAFAPQIQSLLAARQNRQHGYDLGRLPEFLPETADVRDGDWRAADLPQALLDRRVEITGPVDRKMMISALNSGANVFMADFEDATAPSFKTIIAGHENMMDYTAGRLTFEDPKTGKFYAVCDKPAVLILRPRGLHLQEANVMIAGRPMPAALFDFGVSLFHCGAALAAQGKGPFYYLPKLENHREARLWKAIFAWSEAQLGLAAHSIKATVLIETLRAAFEMDEIIWELRDNIVGLNCGRWDYIFSYIKTLRAHSAYVLPDRAAVGMDRAFLADYAALLVQTCHRRGIHAMGGMSAALPVKDDPAANAAAFDRLRADKLREVRLGHDGTWVAHPDMVAPARDIFDAHMSGPNQIDRTAAGTPVDPARLLAPHTGVVSEAGVTGNIATAIEYVAQWLQGRGAVAINGLMEDAATAEIARAQLWQWRRHGVQVSLEAGGSRVLDAAWLGALFQAEIVAILGRHGAPRFHQGRYASAARIIHDAVMAETLPDFITTAAYDLLNALD